MVSNCQMVPLSQISIYVYLCVGTSVRRFPTDVVARKHLVPIDVVKSSAFTVHVSRLFQDEPSHHKIFWGDLAQAFDGVQKFMSSHTYVVAILPIWSP